MSYLPDNKRSEDRITTMKDFKTDVSSVSPSSEQIDELWVLLVFMGVWGSFAIGGNTVI